MTHRPWPALTSLLVAGVIAFLAMAPARPALSASKASPKRTPTPTPTATPLPNAATYVHAYANILNGTPRDVTPEEVQATADGGAIALAVSDSPTATSIDWLVKLDASGRPEWQEELGCLSLPPGSYTDGVSLQQTSDGGYIVGGGTIGCGSGTSCPATSGLQCALAEKVDASGRLQWAYVYPAGAGGSSIRQIRQTSDGGYIAVGSTTTLSQNTGALILKLDAQGAVQWQRDLGPGGSSQGFFNAVQQTPDGGYIATGEYYVPTSGTTPESALAVKLDASGTVHWERALNNLTSTGTPTSTELVNAVVVTADGSSLIGGNWSTSSFPGECCRGGLVVKLDSLGNIQWQKAYTGANSGGTYCYPSGDSETCTAIGAVIYAMHPTADGGYVLAGDENIELSDSAQIVPWIGKIDASGNLLWQHQYFQLYQPTGRPLSEYFASSSVTPNGGTLSLGWTENYSTLKGELFAVKADSAGLAGTCSDEHAATPLTAIDPLLTSFSPVLPVLSAITLGSASPSGTSATSIGTQVDC